MEITPVQATQMQNSSNMCFCDFFFKTYLILQNET